MSTWFKKKKSDKAETKIQMPNGNGLALAEVKEIDKDAITISEAPKEPQKVYLADSDYIEQALRSFGTDPPHVARCFSEGQKIDTSAFETRRMQHCLYESEVYDTMLQDSLNTCELLQHNLDDYIVQVRNAPPNPRTNGHTNDINGKTANIEQVNGNIKDLEITEKSPKSKNWPKQTL